jgi:hypothetical protein
VAAFVLPGSPLFEIAGVVVRPNQVARFMVNANHGVVRPAAMLGVLDCVADFHVPEATE